MNISYSDLLENYKEYRDELILELNEINYCAVTNECLLTQQRMLKSGIQEINVLLCVLNELEDTEKL